MCELLWIWKLIIILILIIVKVLMDLFASHLNIAWILVLLLDNSVEFVCLTALNNLSVLLTAFYNPVHCNNGKIRQIKWMDRWMDGFLY